MPNVLFAVILIVAVFAAVGLGYLVARDHHQGDREQLDQQREALKVEWETLDRARRVNDVFFQARDALRLPHLPATVAVVTVRKVRAGRVTAILFAVTVRIMWWTVEPLLPFLLGVLAVVLVIGFVYYRMTRW